MDDKVIRFNAQVSKVSTLADGGIRITLDLAETAIDIMAELARVRQRGAILEIAAIAVQMDGKSDGNSTNIHF